jgi:hypothetical protein
MVTESAPLYNRHDKSYLLAIAHVCANLTVAQGCYLDPYQSVAYISALRRFFTFLTLHHSTSLDYTINLVDLEFITSYIYFIINAGSHSLWIVHDPAIISFIINTGCHSLWTMHDPILHYPLYLPISDRVYLVIQSILEFQNTLEEYVSTIPSPTYVSSPLSIPFSETMLQFSPHPSQSPVSSPVSALISYSGSPLSLPLPPSRNPQDF